MFDLRLIVWVAVLLFENRSGGNTVHGAIEFRISESEFNKVASVLLQPRDVYTFNKDENTIQGSYNGLHYQFTDVEEKTSRSPEINVQIPEDGKMITSSATSLKQLTGNLRITRKPKDDIIYDGPFDVSLANVTIKTLVALDTVVPADNLQYLEVSNCSASIKSLLINGKSGQNLLEVTNNDLKAILEDTVCQQHSKLLLGFGDSSISFKIVDKPVVINTEASDLKINNGTIFITKTVKTTLKKDEDLPSCNLPSSQLPLARSHPFEIILQADIFNELFLEFKKQLGIGVRKTRLTDLLPNLKDISEMDTQGTIMSMLFPMVGQKFPKALGTMVLSDADIYMTIKNGSVQLHSDITANLYVTLDCDTNRKYNAFNFTMNLIFPTLIGHDNEYLTVKVVKFGGNFTVLNSTVGHIMDRGLMSLLYSAPSFLSKKLDSLNDMFQGIKIQDFLPKSVFTMVSSLTVTENKVVIGGNLSPVDPMLEKIDRSQIQWVGHVTGDYLLLYGRDNTPENPEGFELAEENCEIKLPIDTSSSASGLLCQTFVWSIVVFVVYIW